MGADEAAGADHADGEGRDGVAIQIQAGGRRRGRRRHPPPSVTRRGGGGTGNARGSVDVASWLGPWRSASGHEAMSVAWLRKGAPSLSSDVSAYLRWDGVRV